MRAVLLADENVFKDLLVSEIMFQVTATEYFTDFKPKRVVLRLGSWIFLIDVNHLNDRL